MLETTDILNLEKKWKKYKMKILLKRFLYISIILCISIGSIWGYFYINNNLKTKIDKNNSKLISKQQIEKKVETLKQNKPDKIEQQLLTLQPVQDKKNIQKTKIVTEDKVISPISSVQTKEKPLHVENKTVEKKVLTKISTQIQKPKISIQTSDVDTIKYLKEKFYESHNIVFALMLAEEYLDQDDLKNTLKWSIKANEIDPQSERSWLLFAKAKAKVEILTKLSKLFKLFKNHRILQQSQH